MGRPVSDFCWIWLTCGAKYGDRLIATNQVTTTVDEEFLAWFGQRSAAAGTRLSTTIARAARNWLLWEDAARLAEADRRRCGPSVRCNHVLHERVVLVCVQAVNAPYVPIDERLTIDELGRPGDGIVHLSARFPGSAGLPE